MPYISRPDGLGLADTRSKIFKPKRPSYAKSSANTTKYYTYPKAKKIIAPKAIYKSPANRITSGGGGGISLPGQTNPGGFSIGGTRSNAELKKLARDAVLLELNPQIHSLQHSSQVEQQDYTYLINNLKKQLGLSKADISTLYSALDVSLGANAKTQAQINTTTKANMGTVYDQLNQSLGNSYQGAIGGVNSELNRLGITDPNATKSLTENQQFQQGNASTGKANSQSLLDAIGASTQGQMSLLRGSSASTGSLLNSQLQQGFSKESGDALRVHLQKSAEIKQKINELNASIPSKINQTYAALLDQQYQREMDSAQKLFDNQIKLGGLQVSQANAAGTQSYRQNQLALEAQKIANEAAKNKATTSAPKTGIEKALTYLQNLSYVKTKRIPYATLENILIDAVNGDPKRSDYPGFNKNYVSQYSNDIKNSVNSRGLPANTYTDLINAMSYLFGR